MLVSPLQARELFVLTGSLKQPNDLTRAERSSEEGVLSVYKAVDESASYLSTCLLTSIQRMKGESYKVES